MVQDALLSPEENKRRDRVKAGQGIYAVEKAVLIPGQLPVNAGSVYQALARCALIDWTSAPSQNVRMKQLFCAIAISFCLFPRCAFGYCGVPEIRANGEYFQSDVVFTGTVISSRYTDRDVGGWYYRVRVTRVFRGPTQAEFSVYTEDSDIRFPLEKNRSYLLFAYRRHGRLEIDTCGNSGLLSTAAESIRSIEAIPQALPFGVIEGWVAAETDGIDVSGVRVTVRGHSRNYTAVTNRDGWFEFRAPAGAYKVDFSSGEYYLNGGDYFRYDPNHFVLHAGETASLQVVSVRHLAR